MTVHISLLTVLCLVAACAQFPQIDAQTPALDAPPPSLVPIDTLLVQADGAAAIDTTLLARAERLRTRASLMRGPILDPATRARLSAAIRVGRA
jgi:hypothetical protein